MGGGGGESGSTAQSDPQKTVEAVADRARTASPLLFQQLCGTDGVTKTVSVALC